MSKAFKELNKKQDEVMEFELTLAQVPVKLNGIEYSLREMNGKKRDEYMNKMSERMVFSTDGQAQRLKNFDGVQGDLVALCLFDSNNEPVTVGTIQAYPVHVLTALHEKAKELNNIVDDEEKAKNG